MASTTCASAAPFPLAGPAMNQQARFLAEHRELTRRHFLEVGGDSVIGDNADIGSGTMTINETMDRAPVRVDIRGSGESDGVLTDEYLPLVQRLTNEIDALDFSAARAGGH